MRAENGRGNSGYDIPISFRVPMAMRFGMAKRCDR
nr:MAG TPA: hypothetical protein [Bacteriophage sp.]